MGLKIVKSSEPIRVERLNVCIYSPPGLGKTSLAFTAEAPLLLDFDQGAHRAANRKDIVRIGAWTDVSELTRDDLEQYKTVVVDTAGRALDSLTADILRRNPKAGSGGALTLKGFGTLKAEFVAWLKQLNSFGKDVILVAHSDEKQDGDNIIERLDVQGGSKSEIYKAADAMGRITMRDGRRTLIFSPTDAAFGKNPGCLDALEVPHPDKDPAFLAGVIQTIKDRLNALTEEQIQAKLLLDKWRGSISTMQTAADFNKSLPDARNQPVAIKAMFNAAAKAAGLTFDAETKTFKAPVVANTESQDAEYGDEPGAHAEAQA
jgi:hypothetical protein